MKNFIADFYNCLFTYPCLLNMFIYENFGCAVIHDQGVIYITCIYLPVLYFHFILKYFYFIILFLWALPQNDTYRLLK